MIKSTWTKAKQLAGITPAPTPTATRSRRDTWYRDDERRADVNDRRGRRWIPRVTDWIKGRGRP
jgi:hypothetical protein